MSDPNLMPTPSPLMTQAISRFFHLPWPRKPLNKAKGQGGHGKGTSRQPRTKRTQSKFF